MKITLPVFCNGKTIYPTVEFDGDLDFGDYEIDVDKASEELGFETTKCLDMYNGWEKSAMEIFLKHADIPGPVWVAIFSQWARRLAWTYKKTIEAVDWAEPSTAPLDALRMLYNIVYDGQIVSESVMHNVITNVNKSVADVRRVCDEVYWGHRTWPADQIAIAAEDFCRAVGKIVSGAIDITFFERDESITLKNQIMHALSTGDTSIILLRLEEESGPGPSFFQSIKMQLVEIQQDSQFELLGEAAQIADGWSES